MRQMRLTNKVESLVDGEAMESMKEGRFSGTLYVRWREGRVMYGTLKSEMEVGGMWAMRVLRDDDSDASEVMDPMSGEPAELDGGE
jgi:hypothetical protein